MAHSKQAISTLRVILCLGALCLVGISAVVLHSIQASSSDVTKAAPATPGKPTTAAPSHSEQGAAKAEGLEQNPGRTPNAITARAWKILEEGLREKEAPKRTEAAAALAIVGPQSKAVSLLEAALTDKDPAVRETAVFALGEVKSRRSIPKLRQMLHDDAPEVSFAAARTLWRMGDHSGRRVLLEVLTGERKTSGGELSRKVGEAKGTLHNPKAITKIGVEQGASALLGPFAIGIKVAEELRKDNSGSGRAISASLLATDGTAQSAERLEQALDDKNWLVRAAAAKSLAKRKYRHALPRIEARLGDDHDVVRYSAAGAILALEY
jgi:HEAT repeat protein